MSLEYRHITQFSTVLGPSVDGKNPELMIFGLGDDGWMYQFLGNDAKWERLSVTVPSQIYLPGHESLSTPTIQVEPATPAPEAPPVA